MSSWYDKASEQVQQDHTDGLISDKEYYQQMRDLDEYSKEVNVMFDSLEFPRTLVMQRPKWKIKIRPQKPYYRQKEKY